VYVPLSAVLPRCAAILHHGGFGTTAAALLSGAPQLVAPRAFDQPFNAGRVVALGCGRRLPARRVTPEAIARELGALLRQGRYRRRAAELAEALRAEDGVSATCDEIERACAQKSGAASSSRSS
jgi:UDP:flavonoid glycosyltransferase YjiC (YdhE family)